MEEVNIYEYVEAIQAWEKYHVNYTNKVVKSIDSVIKIISDKKMKELLTKMRWLVVDNKPDGRLSFLDISKKYEKYFVNELEKLKPNEDVDNIICYNTVSKIRNNVEDFEEKFIDLDINPNEALVAEYLTEKARILAKYPEKVFFKRLEEYISSDDLKYNHKVYNTIGLLELKNRNYDEMLISLGNIHPEAIERLKYIPNEFSDLAETLSAYYELAKKCTEIAKALFLIRERPYTFIEIDFELDYFYNELYCGRGF